MGGTENIPRVLSIAGSDNTGGAGIQADLKTFTALGVYGMAAVTAVTVQNTEGVLYVKGIPADVVYRQVKASLGVGVAAVKIGMLWSEETVRGVVRAIKSSGVKKVVLDTVLKASDGTPLISDEGLRIMKEELFPLSLVVTPNVPEAEELCGRRIRDLGDMEECARRILTMGPDAVVIKGGHLEGDRVVDLLCRGEGEVHYFDSERLRIPCVRGTGCTFSSAVAAFLARGFELAESVKRAGDYVRGVIENSLSPGRGCRLPNHVWRKGGCIGGS